MARGWRRRERYEVPLVRARDCASYHLLIDEAAGSYLSELVVIDRKHPGHRYCLVEDERRQWEICLRQDAAGRRRCQQRGAVAGAAVPPGPLPCGAPKDFPVTAKVASFGAPYAHVYIRGMREDTPDRGAPDLWAVIHFDEVPPGLTSAIAAVGLVSGAASVLLGWAAPGQDISAMLIALPLFGFSVLGLSPERIRMMTRIDRVCLWSVGLAAALSALVAVMYPGGFQLHPFEVPDPFGAVLSAVAVLGYFILFVAVCEFVGWWRNSRRYRAAGPLGRV